MSVATPTQTADETPAAPPRHPLRTYRGPITYTVVGLVGWIAFGWFGRSGETSGFGISTGSDLLQISPFSVPSQLTAFVLGLLCLAVAAYSFVVARRGGKLAPAWMVFYAIAFVFAFLCWAVAGEQIHLTSLLQGALGLSVPLVFGALSGVLCERAGVINIAIEGQLLAGAFLSAVVATLTGSVYAGLLAAIVAGLLVAWVLAVFTIKYVVNQIIVGVVLNGLVIGATSFLYGAVLADNAGTWNSPERLARIKIPVLGDLPVIGPVVFNQTLIVYLMYVAVIGIHIALFHTRWGLRVRAIGEHPKAADTLGVAVNRMRFQNVLYGGLVAGLGGAFFTLGNVGAFNQEMSAGQGFIALAAMIFGRWSPFGAFGAALLFGFVNNLQSVLGIIGSPVPNEFMQMAPYLLTIFAVAGLVGRVRSPAASGQPYVKG